MPAGDGLLAYLASRSLDLGRNLSEAFPVPDPELGGLEADVAAHQARELDISNLSIVRIVPGLFAHPSVHVDSMRG